MSAPQGNQFWKLRSKHGRDKLFTSPELLWEAACEYFQWSQDNPLIEIDYKGKDATKCDLPKMRPYTIHGLCNYLGCSASYFRNFKARNDLSDFLEVIERIEQTIYIQKFEGAASGFFNPNIIARDLGLSDRIESKSETTNINRNVEVSEDEAKRIIKAFMESI